MAFKICSDNFKAKLIEFKNLKLFYWFLFEISGVLLLTENRRHRNADSSDVL